MSEDMQPPADRTTDRAPPIVPTVEDFAATVAAKLGHLEIRIDDIYRDAEGGLLQVIEHFRESNQLIRASNLLTRNALDHAMAVNHHSNSVIEQFTKRLDLLDARVVLIEGKCTK